MTNQSNTITKPRGKRRRFRVYFNQVNQTRYDVVATSQENAIKSAAREWRRENSQPTGAYVEGD